MSHLDEHRIQLSDAQVDAALRDLLQPAAAPKLRPGFDVRLARGIATASAADRRRARLRRFLWSYWLTVVLVSAAIVWRLHDSLVSGPGLWMGIGGTVTLLGAAAAFSILAAVPAKLGHRLRSQRG